MSEQHHHHRSKFSKSKKPFKGKSKGRAKRLFKGRLASANNIYKSNKKIFKHQN